MVLVTGSTGLLGSHLLLDLVRHGKKVRALVRNREKIKNVELLFHYYAPDSAAEFLSSIEWFDGDVCDIFSLEDALDGISEVYHCAALVSFDPSDRRRMTEINDIGTANLVNACLDAQIRKLCHVSSTAALGRSKSNEMITEKTQWKNAPENTWYAITKYNAEREVWRGIEEGLCAVIVNPSVILGPADWNSGSTAMFRQGSGGMKFYTEGGNAIVDVRDVSAIMLQLMESQIEEERFLVTGENIRFRDLFNKIAHAFGKKPSSIKATSFMTGFAWRWEKLASKITGRKPLITRETARAAHAVYEYDSSKIIQALNYRFKNADDAISNTVNFLNTIKK